MDVYKELVSLNPGNGSVAEYKYIGSLIEKHSPGNILIFSVGKDSNLWIKLNKLGEYSFFGRCQKMDSFQ